GGTAAPPRRGGPGTGAAACARRHAPDRGDGTARQPAPQDEVQRGVPAGDEHVVSRRVCGPCLCQGATPSAVAARVGKLRGKGGVARFFLRLRSSTSRY